MHGLALLLAAASVGVDYGWQPDADGVMEYIIQIEPELLTALQKGEAIISEIHPDARGVRRFRIQIGSEPLPRITKPASPISALPPDASPAKPPISTAAPPPSDLPTTRNSTFTLEESPAAPANSPPSDFPLLPLTEEKPEPLEELPAAVENRQGSFQLPTTELPSTPKTATPLEAKTAPTQSGSTQPQKPVPLPDPDRLPLEPAPLPLTEKEAASQAISITESANSTPRLATFNQQADSKRPAETASSESAGQSTSPVSRPWFLFSLTIIALLGSLGANAYLGYLFIGLQHRYHGLRRESRA